MITKVNSKPDFRNMSESDIINYNDAMLLWKDKEAYDRRWQVRCDNCLSLCCILEPGGYMYKYWEEAFGNDFDDTKQFWNFDFPIILNSKFDFDDRLEPTAISTVRVCPLAIDGKCFIYEDRPKMCKIYKCMFAQSKYLGVK